MTRRDHWNDVYARKGERETSWFEESPGLSLSLIEAAGVGREAAVIDIGGGMSHLVDALAARGQAAVTVLDISENALAKAAARLPDPGRVTWIAADVTMWEPDRRYDLWHDRAAFHFLTEEADRRAYVRVLEKALKPGGATIIGTFAMDGPEKCSSLPVARYDADALLAVLGPGFTLEASHPHAHTTPWGAVQRFQFSTFRRN